MAEERRASDEQAVLMANEAFYVAFSGRDLDAMGALWADTEAVSCIHPGWNPLVSQQAVLSSWQAILGAPGSPRIRYREPRVALYGDTAVVVCFEQIDEAFLVASNVFRRIDGGWRLVHHQAGPAAAPLAHAEDGGDDDAPSGRVLN